MSMCKCENSTSYRITGEISARPPNPERKREFGSGSKIARIRCGQCAGKVAYVGSDLLVALGIPEDQIRPGARLDPDEYVTLTVDLI